MMIDGKRRGIFDRFNHSTASVTVVTTVTGFLERVSIYLKNFFAGRSGKKRPKFNSDSPEEWLQRLQSGENLTLGREKILNLTNTLLKKVVTEVTVVTKLGRS
jgi:hypothetical protein